MGKLKENMIVSESQNSEIDDYLCCLDSDEMPKTEATIKEHIDFKGDNFFNFMLNVVSGKYR